MTDRRKFLFGAIAGMAAVYIGYATASLITPPPDPLRYLYVAPTYALADIERQLFWLRGNDRGTTMFIGAGAMICGYGFDRIILAANWDIKFPSRAMARDYLNQTLRTRLYPDGTISYED